MNYERNSTTKMDYHELLHKLEYYKIGQTILSKQFPSDRYNGIINMFYIYLNHNATSEEIQNVLVIFAVLLIQ